MSYSFWHSPDRFAGQTYSINVSMECVRGLAALWVFLFHVSDLVQTSFPFIYGIAKIGYFGVPVFFAVSGYCIFAAAQKCIQEQSGSKPFLRRRLLRIFPTFWISILVMLVLPYVIEGLASLKTGSMHWPAPRWMQYNWLDWVGIVSLTKEALDNVRGGGEGYTLINSVYWTLSIEVQFYFVMYIAISFRRHWMIILGAVTLVSIVSLATSFLIWPGFFLQFWPAFFCGALLRLAYSRNLVPGLIFGKFELPGSVAVLGLILVLLLAREHIQPGITFIETAAAAALALWALGGIEHGCAARGKPVNAFRRLAGKLLIPFVLLGQCSYSLYLLHGKLYQLPSMFVRQLVPTTAPLHLVSIVLGTIVLSYAFYYLVERRYQGHAVSKPAQPQARPATCVVADEVS